MLKLTLTICLAGALVMLGAPQTYRFGGAYVLSDTDHADLMASHPASPQRTVSVLFVGNSLTFVNDMPAMLANIASSDTRSPVALQVKAITSPGAKLDYLYAQTPALAWARQHHVDVVVLQEHSNWYDTQPGFQDALDSASDWASAVRGLNEKPIYFQIWAEGAGSPYYSNRSYVTYGRTPTEESKADSEGTERLAAKLDLAYAPVGDAFERAAETQGAPDLYQPDRRHPSLAGSYLAALVFYKVLTGRTGGQASYHPWGMSDADAALLVRISSSVVA